MASGRGPSASGHEVGAPVVNKTANGCAATVPLRAVTIAEPTNWSWVLPGSGIDGTSFAHHGAAQSDSVAVRGDALEVYSTRKAREVDPLAENRDERIQHVHVARTVGRHRPDDRGLRAGWDDSVGDAAVLGREIHGKK